MTNSRQLKVNNLFPSNSGGLKQTQYENNLVNFIVNNMKPKLKMKIFKNLFWVSTYFNSLYMIIYKIHKLYLVQFQIIYLFRFRSKYKNDV